jgi:hypothetical protein
MLAAIRRRPAVIKESAALPRHPSSGNDHVRFRQRVNEEVSSLEHDLVRETVASKLVCDPRHGAHVNGLLTVAEGIKSDSGLVRQ